MQETKQLSSNFLVVLLNKDILLIIPVLIGPILNSTSLLLFEVNITGTSAEKHPTHRTCLTRFPHPWGIFQVCSTEFTISLVSPGIYLTWKPIIRPLCLHLPGLYVRRNDSYGTQTEAQAQRHKTEKLSHVVSGHSKYWRQEQLPIVFTSILYDKGILSRDFKDK